MPTEEQLRRAAIDDDIIRNYMIARDQRETAWDAMSALLSRACDLVDHQMFGFGDGYGGAIFNVLADHLNARGFFARDYICDRIKGKIEAIADRDGWDCAYCSTPLGWGHSTVSPPEVEHVIPKSRGGTNALSNLVLACRNCNSQKGTKTADEYRAWKLERTV